MHHEFEEKTKLDNILRLKKIMKLVT